MVRISLGEEDGVTEFVGVSYSPLTQKAQGEVSAKLNFHDNKVNGKLNVGGFNIPVKRDGEAVEASHHESRYSATFHLTRSENQFTVEETVANDNGQGTKTVGRDLNVKLELKGEHVVGYLSRRGDFGKLAYTMWPQQNHSGKNPHGLLVNDGEGYDDAPPQPMPPEGLPSRPPLDASGGGHDE